MLKSAQKYLSRNGLTISLEDLKVNENVMSASDEITKEVQVKEKPVTVIANSAPAAPNSSVVLAKDVPKLPVTGLVAKKVRNLDDYKGLLAAISIMKFRMNGKHI